MNELERETSIEDYAAIGDCRTLALVSRFGSIEWCCIPDFPSPSVFAALLDRERGGRFAITPRGIVSAVQRYLPRTNVLLTRIECRSGVLELTEFMTMPEAADASPQIQEIVRIAECVAGAIELDVRFEPRPDYSRKPARLMAHAPGHWSCSPGPNCFELRTTFALQGDDASLAGSVAMRAGEAHAAVLVAPARHGSPQAPLPAFARQRLAATVGWWRSWCDGCTYRGDHADAVLRSALALKLLTHRPTGGLVAAATTSIPESETGARNWDYRFCWLRDSSLVFDAFTELGYSRESGAFLQWLLHATHRTRPRLQVVYDMYGGHELDERVLPELRGYHGIGPVLVGNAASNQQQNDVYGEVIITAFDWVRRGGRLDDAEKELVAQFVQMACDVWRSPDNGIWEIRTAPRHNTHSKLMCWAALDRALALHAMHGVPIDPVRIRRERDAIREDIEANAWNASLGSYVGIYGTDAPDASLLLMPRLGYLDAHDPRMLGTTRRVQQELSVDGLLYRFPPGRKYDGVEGGEHLFAICSFWLVDCLARQARIDEAQKLYERLLSLRTQAGLYAEEFDVKSGRPVGNFPQAFSHVGSITAALSLQAATSGRRPRSVAA
jgi:GH15 family glucan-1,4-alpha-glucosidase